MPIMNATAVIRCLAFAMAFLLLMATACKSNVDRVVDWYEEASTREPHNLPSISECDRWKNDYWIMVEVLENTGDRFATQYALMASQNVPQTALQAYSETWTATIDSIYQGWVGLTGWAEWQAGYCEGRYNAAHDPSEVCAVYSTIPVSALRGSSVSYGRVEYCIEHSIPPFRWELHTKVYIAA
ncbi:MAG: hypothetical protein OXI54_03065 [Chloroflexota bacterium]|nr:hypothetical protein [Chloroflexota bacterium]MDE2683114.1 hypothetical protein [Chloroflexota bacterium]